MNKKFFLVILALIALLVFQVKIVMPFVTEVATSDLFLEDITEEQIRMSASSSMSIMGFDHCNSYIANDLLADYTLTFPSKPINSFGLGNFGYVVNADLEILPSSGAAITRKYVCRIKYDKDSNNPTDIENWSIVGISGLDDL